MCRLFGILSTKKRLDLSPDLLSSPCSFFAQSHADPQRKQKDGWGMAWRQSGAARVFKSGLPIYQERKKFTRLVRTIRSRSVLAHLRHASNPLGLKESLLIGPRHSQPFVWKQYSFVHNGCLNIPLEIKRDLGPLKSKVKGRNDSEVLFWLLMKHVRSSRGDVPKAFRNAVREVWKTWDDLDPKLKNMAAPYFGLNMILSDGKRLWALCKYDGVRPRLDSSLTEFERSPYYEMRYAVEKNRVRVASERTTPGGPWRRLRNGTLLEAKIADGKISVKTRPNFIECRK